MTRVARAAKTLAQQILTQWPDATVTNAPEEEADGLGVLRSLRVDAPEGEQVFEVLKAIMPHDHRIKSLGWDNEAKAVTVTVASNRLGDLTDPFAIPAVVAVQDDAETDVNSGSGPSEAPSDQSDDKPKGKKAAAKKATAKSEDPDGGPTRDDLAELDEDDA